MSVVNDAIQYRIAEGRVGNDVVPLCHGDLTCDQERSLVVAVVDDLEEIAPLIGGERLWSPVIAAMRYWIASFTTLIASSSRATACAAANRTRTRPRSGRAIARSTGLDPLPWGRVFGK
jgi:hypothetical protein